MPTAFNPYITDAGRAAILALPGPLSTLAITHVSLGTGVYALDASARTRTTMVALVETVAISAGVPPAVSGDGIVRMSVEFPPRASGASYAATEVGFWCGNPAADGILFAIWSDLTAVAVNRDAIPYVAAFSLTLVGIDPATVSITIDPTAPASAALMAAHVAAADPHPNYATELNLIAQTYTSGTTAGTGTAYTVAAPVAAPLSDLRRVTVKLHAANGASPTLNVDGTGAKAIKIASASGAKSAPPAGALAAGAVLDLIYDGVDWVAPALGSSGQVALLASGGTVTGGYQVLALDASIAGKTMVWVHPSSGYVGASLPSPVSPVQVFEMPAAASVPAGTEVRFATEAIPALVDQAGSLNFGFTGCTIKVGAADSLNDGGLVLPPTSLYGDISLSGDVFGVAWCTLVSDGVSSWRYIGPRRRFTSASSFAMPASASYTVTRIFGGKVSNVYLTAVCVEADGGSSVLGNRVTAPMSVTSAGDVFAPTPKDNGDETGLGGAVVVGVGAGATLALPASATYQWAYRGDGGQAVGMTGTKWRLLTTIEL